MELKAVIYNTVYQVMFSGYDDAWVIYETGYNLYSEEEYIDFLGNPIKYIPTWKDSEKWTDEFYDDNGVKYERLYEGGFVLENDRQLNFVDDTYIRGLTNYEKWLKSPLTFEMPMNQVPNHEMRELVYLENPAIYKHLLPSEGEKFILLDWKQDRHEDSTLCKYYWQIKAGEEENYRLETKKVCETNFITDSHLEYLKTITEGSTSLLEESEVIAVSDINNQTYGNALLLAEKGNSLNYNVSRVYDYSGSISTYVKPTDTTVIQELLAYNQEHQVKITNEFHTNLEAIIDIENPQDLIYTPFTESEYCKSLGRVID